MLRSATTLVIPFLSVLIVANGFCESASANVDEPEPKALYTVVTRTVFAPALQRWVTYRREQGFDVRVGVLDDLVSAGGYNSEAVTDWLTKEAEAAGRQPSYILLVGDVGEGAPWHVPTMLRHFYRWRLVQRNYFASDMAYGDLDGDDIPDVPVGRLPVRTQEELAQQIEKIIRYEARQPTPNHLRIVAWAGTSGFGAVNDFLVPLFTLQVLSTGIPSTFNAWTICANPASPFCGYPPEQPTTFLAAMQAGSAVSVMVAHGWPDRVVSMMHEEKWVTLDLGHAQQLSGEEPLAPLVLICCFAGAYELPRQRCVAEAFLLQPGGPIVTVAASYESHPLTNCYTAVALASQLGSDERTIGDWWLAVQRDASTRRNVIIEQRLLHAEGNLEPTIDVAKLRRDHMLQYNLLGDPACRRFRPEPMPVEVVCQERKLTLTGEVPEGCEEIVVQLVSPLLANVVSEPTFGLMGEELIEAQRRNFEAVNAPPATLYQQAASARTWQSTITLPPGLDTKRSALRITGLGPTQIWTSAHAVKP